MPSRLTLDKVTHVSLVDEPAVGESEYVVMKHADAPLPDPDSDTPLLDRLTESDTTTETHMDDDTLEKLTNLVEKSATAATEAAEAAEKAASAAENTTDDDDNAPTIESLQAQVQALEEQLEADGDGDDDPDSDDDGDDSLEKRLKSIEKALESDGRKGQGSNLDASMSDSRTGSGVKDITGHIQKSRGSQEADD